MHQQAHKYFEQGMENAAKAHGLFPDTRTAWQRDMDTVNQRSEMERAKNAQVAPYTRQEPELQYPPAEVMIDRVMRPAIKLVSLLSVCGVIASVAFGFAASDISAVSVWMAANTGYAALGAVVCVGGLLAWSSRGAGESANIGSASAQNINVTVNVGGTNATVNQK